MQADLAFKGSKAAPFVKGGGRSKAAPNDAKGRTRKVLTAKARAKAARMKKGSTADNSIDLADKHGGTWKHGYVPTNPIAVAEKDHKFGKSNASPARSVSSAAKAARRSAAGKGGSGKSKGKSTGRDKGQVFSREVTNSPGFKAHEKKVARAKAAAPSKSGGKLHPEHKRSIEQTAKAGAPSSKDPSAPAHKLDPNVLSQAMKSPNVSPERQRELKSELAKRKASIKDLQRQSGAAKNYLNENAGDLKNNPNKFFAGLYKIAPGLKPHIEKLRNSSVGSKLRDKQYMENVISTVAPAVAAALIPGALGVLAGSAAVVAGVHTANKIKAKRAAKKGKVDLAEHVPGTPYKYKHGWIKLSASDGRFKRLADSMHSSGGFTHDLRSNTEPSSGFSVAVPSPDGKDWRALPHGSTSEDDLKKFAMDHKNELSKPNRGIGGWSNGDKNEGDVRDALDIVQVHGNISDAADAAEASNQDGIFDLKTFEYIPTAEARKRAKEGK